jgi:hypothetical protein
VRLVGRDFSNSSIKPGKLADQLVKYSHVNRLARDP